MFFIIIIERQTEYVKRYSLVLMWEVKMVLLEANRKPGFSGALPHFLSMRQKT
jgi:hypothetical protein